MTAGIAAGDQHQRASRRQQNIFGKLNKKHLASHTVA
jgi:hypothetical protein